MFLINFLPLADVWSHALNAFIDHNLWSIQGTWKLLMPEIIQFKRAPIVVAHLEDQILAKAVIPVEGNDTSGEGL